jgi:poly(A) polymerase
MEASGIVSAIFPDIKAMKGCPQNRYHHLDVWGHTLEAIQRLEEIAHRPTRYFGNMGGRIEPYLKEELVPARSKAALLKIAVLFHDIGKPQARTVDEEGRIRFFGHEKISRRIFEHVATRLKLARREIKLVGEWVGGHMRTMIFTREPVSRRAIYRLHRAFGEDILGLLLLFLADLAATRGPASRPNSEELALRYVREALTEAIALRRQPRQRFLNGRDLMALFELQPGPRLGALLKKLDELQGIGEIQSREEAIEVISRLVTENEVTE